MHVLMHYIHIELVYAYKYIIYMQVTDTWTQSHPWMPKGLYVNEETGEWIDRTRYVLCLRSNSVHIHNIVHVCSWALQRRGFFLLTGQGLRDQLLTDR